MPTEVVMPQMGESITEGTLTKWLKKPGDKVERDEPLFEISTDKVDAEIPSPAAGTLQEIKVAEGATVQINTVVALIDDGAGSTGAPAANATPTPAAATPATARRRTDAASSPYALRPAPPAQMYRCRRWANPSPRAPSPSGSRRSVTPSTRDEPLFEISTDKVDAEIPSPAAGTLIEIKFAEGSTVGINTVVAVIGGGKVKPSGNARTRYGCARGGRTCNRDPSRTATAISYIRRGTSRSSPLVRKIAKDNNVDLARVPGTGPSGRITKMDILGYIEHPAAKPHAGRRNHAPSPPLQLPAPGTLVPMTKMRSIIAQRMVESKRTSPHVHTVFKVDMTRIVRLREKEKSKYEQRTGVKLTYMPFITRAAIAALRKHAIVNASVEGDAIRYNRNINIGIAVALEWGLIVPVIHQAEEKNFLGIARAIADVAERARGKKLSPDEVQGGTFTLTNSGIFGEQFGMPIINQPQAAILGIGGLNKEAEVLTDKDGNDSIAIRSVQRFCLGFDHRIVDGADAGKFMADFKAYLENWDEEIG